MHLPMRAGRRRGKKPLVIEWQIDAENSDAEAATMRTAGAGVACNRARQVVELGGEVRGNT
jgi:hypothetical protein